MIVPGEGPIPAKIMIVGEAPGVEEERSGHPFVGASGRELDKMLHEAGILRSQCYVSNVCQHRPPDNDMSAWVSLKKKGFPPEWAPFRQGHVHPLVREGIDHMMKEISLVQPNIIIALGNLSLWALTGLWGISKWRGSELRVDWSDGGPLVLPTYHPAYILRDWAERSATVRDLQRVRSLCDSRLAPRPAWRFTIRPSFETACEQLTSILARLERGPCKLVNDLETRSGHIACSGLAWSADEAICIPLMCVERAEGYWTPEQELEIIWLHKQILEHPNAEVVNQNYLYDTQYWWRWFGIKPRFKRDTMISHHTAFCELPKSLDYQASLYCKRYRYWKDDARDWDPKLGEDQLWTYNCEDCVRTWEVDDVTQATVRSLRLDEVNDFQQRLFWPTFQAMERGIRLDPSRKAAMRRELDAAAQERQNWLDEVIGHKVDSRSPTHLMKLFYEDLRQPVVIQKKTKRPTIDEKALEKIARREPLLAPIAKKLTEMRSIGVFKSTFIDARLDLDSRLRCSFNPCGTYTFRYSSSKNAFWNGTNLQNIPKGVEAKEPEDLELPNIRKFFVPDEGFTFFDLDLDRADLQVVVWEAADEDLKAKMRLGVDMHCANAVDIWSIKGIPVEELVEKHPNYPEHKARIGAKRQLSKAGVHAVDYYCQARTLAMTLGTSIVEAQRFIDRWFGAHPGIKKWQDRTKDLAEKKGYVQNIFGYRWYLFDRLNLPDALAWQPQSVVGRVINTAWQRIYKEAPWIQVLLQVHDSLAGQFPTARKQEAMNLLYTLGKVVVPYPDPLVIPTGLKVSEHSWGECE